MNAFFFLSEKQIDPVTTEVARIKGHSGLLTNL